MKSYKIFFTSLICLCCSLLNAQTTYKRVTIDRDHENNNVIVVRNDNSCAVEIAMEYKIGSRDAEWRSFDMWQTRQPIRNPKDREKGNRIEANETVRFRVPSKIYALKLTYVHLNVGEYIEEWFDVLNDSRNQVKQNSNNQ